MNLLWLHRTPVVMALVAALIAACEHEDAGGALAGRADDVPCRSRVTRPVAIDAVQEWIARHKSRQFTEVIDDVSWHGDLWEIGFTIPTAGSPDLVVITMMPDGEIVRCEAGAECTPPPVPADPACPAGQMRIATQAQALSIATSFLEKRGVPVDAALVPSIYTRPAWNVGVLLEPPKAGGFFTLLISADGDVVGVIPGQ